MRVENKFRFNDKVFVEGVMEVFRLLRVCDCDMIMSEKLIVKGKLCACPHFDSN